MQNMENMRSDGRWEDDGMCFACGKKNPLGLKMTFAPFGDHGLQSRIKLDKHYQGFKDVVHGGFLALLLDEVIVNHPWKLLQQYVVTAELSIRLHKPALVNETLVITAFPDGKMRGRLLPMRGEIRLTDGTLIASALAKCMKIK